jgi:hypothetical protein
MSTAFDALPAIVPFFGVLFSSFTVGFCFMNRRIRRLESRVEELEIHKSSPPQIVIQSTEQQAPRYPPPPPQLIQPPVYPVQQPYPYYQSYPPASAPYSMDPKLPTI